MPTLDLFPQLETERLVLREIVLTDVDDLFRLLSDDQAMQYWSCRPHTTADQTRQLIDNMAAAARSEMGIHWGIALRGDNRLIGKCGYNEWRKKHRRADTSYIVSPQHWGHGIVSEAMRAVLDYGFGTMDLHSAEAGVTPGNDASTRMLERLGFRLEGHLRESYFAEDKFVDSLIYSLLRRDWKPSADRPVNW